MGPALARGKPEWLPKRKGKSSGLLPLGKRRAKSHSIQGALLPSTSHHTLALSAHTVSLVVFVEHVTGQVSLVCAHSWVGVLCANDP